MEVKQQPYSCAIGRLVQDTGLLLLMHGVTNLLVTVQHPGHYCSCCQSSFSFCDS